MKRILIAGANSYIGTALDAYLKQWPDRYGVDTVDMKGDAWRDKRFGKYDAVYHVAGIAHTDIRNLDAEGIANYKRVNTDLAVEVAVKAKAEGVRQFIFMSSANVYGDNAPIGKKKIITKDTVPQPVDLYGESKRKAELGILPLQGRGFKVVILRPPMIYGKGCKGNYPKLAKLARTVPIFPYVDSYLPMIHIDNLNEFVRLLVEQEEYGIFCPQNAEPVNTSLIAKEIAAAHGKRLILVKGFGWALKILGRFTGMVNKAFGNLTYDPEMSAYKTAYVKYGFKQSIWVTEKD